MPCTSITIDLSDKCGIRTVNFAGDTHSRNDCLSWTPWCFWGLAQSCRGTVFNDRHVLRQLEMDLSVEKYTKYGQNAQKSTQQETKSGNVGACALCSYNFPDHGSKQNIGVVPMNAPSLSVRPTPSAISGVCRP